ncbi:MAG TPA: ATPase inhibitor subunit zeta [Stellaceae bacterium]|nr:ATPase inhibitor subunit zeta [Stellaceae bacterium]
MTDTGSPAATPRLPIDDAIEECVISRRNFYLGLWAGRQLDLPEAALGAYAQTVVEADHEEPGHDDVIRKIAGDFAAHDVAMTRAEILRQLIRTHLLAARQFGMSD